MDELVLDMQEKMNKSIDSLKQSLTSLRTGKATPAMLNGIEVDYYGTMTPINQMSSVSVPEPRQLLIKPYSREDVKSIVAAINASNLGLAPINDGTSVRLNIPALTEERRRELAKQSKSYGDEGKVAIRKVRQSFMDDIKKDKETPEDLRKHYEECIQKATDDFNKIIDGVIADKEKEIMTI
jgi:ribosome recycling factor